MSGREEGEQKVVSQPTFEEMVLEAVTQLKSKRGSSLRAIKKYIEENNQVDIKEQTPFIRKAIDRALNKGILVHVARSGTAGNYKLPVQAKPAAKDKQPKAKKGKAAGSPKAQKTAAKKPEALSPKEEGSAKAKAPAKKVVKKSEAAETQTHD